MDIDELSNKIDAYHEEDKKREENDLSPVNNANAS